MHKCKAYFTFNCISKDINECLLRNGHGACEDKCVNTVGAYTCSCENLKGTKLSKDGHSCEPVEVCSLNNGGCSHTCHDTIGNWIKLSKLAGRENLFCCVN